MVQMNPHSDPKVAMTEELKLEQSKNFSVNRLIYSFKAKITLLKTKLIHNFLLTCLYFSSGD